MIGLDTNLLLRALIVEDGPQTHRAQQFIARTCSPEEPGHVNCVVLAETSWVLRRVFGYGKADIARALGALLEVRELVIEHEASVRAALSVYARSTVEFSDLLIAELNRSNGCTATATFDRKAAKLDGFTAV
jgi:predicted nucleic-acid-binding protein